MMIIMRFWIVLLTIVTRLCPIVSAQLPPQAPISSTTVVQASTQGNIPSAPAIPGTPPTSSVTASAPTWISAIANVVMALGLLLAWRQLKASFKDTAADHERSRRELAIELMTSWIRSYTPQMSAARKLVEGFSRDQITAMWKQEPFEISISKKDLVFGSLVKADKLELTESVIKLSEDESSELRWQVISLLNGLESVLIAWLYNVADRTMLEDEFRPLVSPTEGHYILKTFREVAGVHYQPALQAFALSIEKQAQNVPTGKPPIV